MERHQKAFIAPTAPIADAIRIIDESRLLIALIVDGDQKLVGTVTDGDIRRGILKSIPLDAPVAEIMNAEPRVTPEGTDDDARLALMRAVEIDHLPVIDSEGRVTGLILLKDFTAAEHAPDNWVLLMAGGIGSRLRPMTESTPKPLLKVGPKPLLETIIESFTQYRFHRFYVSVNYKAELVKEHFGDGSRWNVEIRYIEEDERLGTAGALGLIPTVPKEPLIVMNADLLTRINFQSLLDFHREQKAQATMCVREYDFQVPFGVVKIQNHRLTAIEEKPVHTFFVNAGIYVLEPELLSLVPKNEHLDMTELFERVIEAGHETAVFPVREYWLDVGRIDDLERANGDIVGLFS
jgi:dTDP-glucose pyrophosphorylase